ncbi:MAG: hypothetical protein QGI83_21470 [Candidatus Latescibacteria bacterium]|nr:hypothetical protein [Candidatus Latescibacterota bacterium]
MDAPDRTRFWMGLEDLFILLSIFALWPTILGWNGWIWESLKYVAVVGLIWIFVRRVSRYRSRDQADPMDN